MDLAISENYEIVSANREIEMLLTFKNVKKVSDIYLDDSPIRRIVRVGPVLVAKVWKTLRVDTPVQKIILNATQLRRLGASTGPKLRPFCIELNF